MAKKKSKGGDCGMGMTMPKAPSPKQQMRWAAEGVARTAVENHPRMKKMRDEITRAVESAVSKHLGSGAAKKGRFE